MSELKRAGSYLLLPGMLALAVSAFAAGQNTAVQRLRTSADTLKEMTGAHEIPPAVLAKAECIAVIPNMMKGAFLAGAQYGAGYASCRNATGWSAPAPINLEGGSVGFQAGYKNSDIVLAFMNSKAKQHLLANNLKFGAGISATAGPVGAGASTHAANADVLVWARTNGAFAGADVNGVKLSVDQSAVHELYGNNNTGEQQILDGQVSPPASSQPFLMALRQVTSPTKG